MKKNGIDHSFKKLARHLTEAVVLTDSKGRITWTNSAFRKLCGYTTKEVIGRKQGHFLEGKQTDAKTVRALHKAVKKGDSIQVEIVNYHKNGTPYWASVSITPVKGDHGQVTGFIAIEKDTTKHHETLASLEQQIVQVYNALLLSEAEEEASINHAEAI